MQNRIKKDALKGAFRGLIAKLSIPIFFFIILAGLNSEALAKTNDKKDILKTLYEIIPYPNASELADAKFQKDWIDVTALSPDDINGNFSNIGDLGWLEPIAKKNKVFLLGENHWYETTHKLCNRVLFALNQFDRYSLITIENQYSITPFLDYYVGLGDEEAGNFYRNVIYDFVISAGFYNFLEHIRLWNMKYPEKRIHVAAHDIEHDFKSTLKIVIVPYFKKLRPSFEIDLDRLTYLDLPKIIEEARGLLKKAKAGHLTGNYPFITPQYIENVMDNLESLFMSKNYEFDEYRQSAILRNLMDPKFLGKYFLDGKAMIYGGSYHTATHFRYPKGNNYYREGSYLTYDFVPTAGKTYSLAVEGMSYQMGKMADVDLKSILRNARLYISRVSNFQAAYKNKMVSAMGYYFFDKDELDDFDKMLLLNAYSVSHQPMLVNKIDWDKILRKTNEMPPDIYGVVRKWQDDINKYDAYIFIPRSPIEVTLSKRIN